MLETIFNHWTLSNMTPNSPSKASKIRHDDEDSTRTIHGSPRYDRINNLGGAGTTKKKRIRARSNGNQVMNTLNRQDSFSGKRIKASPIVSKPRSQQPSPSKQSTLPLSSPSKPKPIKRKCSSSESDSDIELNLIKVNNYSSSPVKGKSLDKEEVEKMDELIGISDRSDRYVNSTRKELTSERLGEVRLTDYRTVNSLARGEFLETIKDRRANARAQMEKKHKHKYPEPIRSRKELSSRANRHLHHILDIIEGRSTAVSKVHDLAIKRQRESQSETLSQREYWQLDWQPFCAGYFGFQRQQYLGSLIISKYSGELERAAERDPVISFWTQDRYACYVLANDLAVRIVMEDFKCNFEDAEEILRTSSEYGVAVTDEIELEDNESREEEGNGNGTPQNNHQEQLGTISNSPKKSKYNQDPLDILDQLIHSDSDPLDH